MIKGLYIHIPFCDHICSYCDFYKMRAKEEVKQKYIENLIEELAMKTDYVHGLETIYIGGGTPSSLSFLLLEKLFVALKEKINLANLTEFTIEANPNDISLDFVQLLQKYHVNRISLGIQSFEQNKQTILGRNHTKEDCINALQILQDQNFHNVNVDLIYGIEEDAFAVLESDILLAQSLGVKHFSVYSLILEEKTLLYHYYMQDKFHPMEDDAVADIYQSLQKVMEKTGFLQYEISNFSLPGYQSKHNLIYWNNDEYIGLGASSSYFYNHTRYKNIAHLDKYSEGIKQRKLVFQEEEVLTKEKEIQIFLMMGLRKVEGISLTQFKELFALDFFTHCINAEKLLKQGYLQKNGDYVAIPTEKLFLSNAILVRLF